MNELIETFSDKVHLAWMQTKRAQGVTSRLSETGEELMVPYSQLSEKAKDLDRASVVSVLKAIETAGYTIIPVTKVVDRNKFYKEGKES